ncbi:hypothetical protein vipetofem_43 [Enterococcus phage vipetofem]|uniref:Uncharacterized protein n=1 Tax=Enterococcus phage vipetofem TaxID=2719594 RepID=A0A6G9LMX3_9CAUD|nr:hypothetical protein KNU92_gp097 [Enterococcus phage vipetofem]QIQ66341.1 hypothetical protein vipetofem_43 [Enterococcus phage vipetofem]SCO93467.1 hypothetical protein [Enterococcus phage VPE25]SCZ84035.1 hypothetical protein [Enterococcus phage VFW]
MVQVAKVAYTGEEQTLPLDVTEKNLFAGAVTKATVKEAVEEAAKLDKAERPTTTTTTTAAGV